MFVIKIKTLKFYAHTFLSYNDKAGGKGSNIIGRCYLVYSSCGRVVRDFESEAKTRCNFQFP